MPSRLAATNIPTPNHPQKRTNYSEFIKAQNVVSRNDVYLAKIYATNLHSGNIYLNGCFVERPVGNRCSQGFIRANRIIMRKTPRELDTCSKYFFITVRGTHAWISMVVDLFANVNFLGEWLCDLSDLLCKTLKEQEDVYFVWCTPTAQLH